MTLSGTVSEFRINVIIRISFVQLGPGLKSKTKALDQIRTLNSLWIHNPDLQIILAFLVSRSDFQKFSGKHSFLQIAFYLTLAKLWPKIALSD